MDLLLTGRRFDAEEASRICRNGDVAAVLTDAMLPGMKGPELIRLFRDIAPQLPVALMSAHARDTLTRDHGVDQDTPVLRKPFTHEDALALMGRLLPSQTKAVILVVEDNEAARLALEELLVDEGHSVLTAATVSEAREVTSEDGAAIDLVLTDVKLPDGTGPELVEGMRENRPDLRVVYASGQSPSADLQALLGEQRASFVKKPADLATFVTAVTEQLDG